MKVDVKANAVLQVDIDEIEALNILCKALDMEFVLDENPEYFVRKDEYGENTVYITDEHNTDIRIDDRGDLFVALRNVVVNIVPNTLFRSADYIYGE